MIPYGRQEITQEDEEAVLRVLRSDFLTQGPAVPDFEKEQARLVQAPFAVAMNSATSALHAACAALGLGPGKSLWTSPNTFVASANCALYCGAEVDFVDIDPATLNLCPRRLEEKLIAAEKSGQVPAIVVPVHFGGLSCDMAPIHTLSQRFGFKIIEDASHAVGGSYRGQLVGSCLYSDITIFSYHPVKIVTSAEGGMALTRDPELARKMQLFRSHGITRDIELMEGDSHGPWYYQQVDLGYNYRMTDLQAALGRSQLDRLGDYVQRRNKLAESYREALKGLPLTWQAEQVDTLSAYHLFTIQLHDSARRLAVFNGLRAAGIGVNVHYIPVHTQPHYRRLGFKNGQFPAAEGYYAGALSLPMFPHLTRKDFVDIVSALKANL